MKNVSATSRYEQVTFNEMMMMMMSVFVLDQHALYMCIVLTH